MDEKAKFTKTAACSFLALLLLILTAASLRAQEGRKVIANPTPAYPETARKFRVTGVVKVEIVIALDGHIKATKIIGGHPLLVSAVEDTLKNWKYAPAATETTSLLEFRFNP